MSASTPPPAVPDDDEILTPEEEEELVARCEESERAEERGELIPWEALFPPQRLTG